MSQEKVDRYKEQKKNRKKTMKKEKRLHFLGSFAGIIVCASIVVWAGWSVYQKYESSKPASYTEVNLSAIEDYFASQGEN